MTIAQKSSWFAAAVLALLFILMAFNYGRLTASTIQLRSQCDITAEQRAQLKPTYYSIGWGR